MAEYVYETVLVDVDRGVATVTLNRPEQRNALNGMMQLELPAALMALDADDTVRAIVVTGAPPAFCAGADLSRGSKAFGGRAQQGESAKVDEIASSIVERLSFWRMRTPTIAAINGAAYGGGLTLSLLLDVRFVAEDARLSLPFTRLGIVPEGNSNWLLPRLVGLSRALELLLSGRTFTGREAAEIGLVSRALPAAEVLPAARQLARDIATRTAPAAVAATKQLVYGSLELDDRAQSMHREMLALFWLGGQPDAAEGVGATRERREPVWQGSKSATPPALDGWPAKRS